MTTRDLWQILRECQRTKVPVFVGSNGIDISFQTLINDIQDQTVILENKVRPEFIRPFSSASRFFLQCKMLRLASTKVHPYGAHMAFVIQESVAEAALVGETRQSERLLFSPEEKVVAEFTNPFDCSTVLKRPVMDMSATGLSVRMNSASLAFAPGVVFDEMRVAIGNKPYLKAAGEVIYNRKFLDLNGRLRVQVGIKFNREMR